MAPARGTLGVFDMLPAEVRVMVYTNYIFSCLDEDLMIVGPSRSRSIDVLLTCKTFYEEAKPHLDEMRWEECIMRVGLRRKDPIWFTRGKKLTPRYQEMDDLLSTPHDRIIRPPTPLTSVPKIQEMRFSTRAGVTQHLDRIHVLHIQLDANGDRHEAEESTFASWVSTFDAYTSMLTRLRDITITLGRERFMWHKKCDSIWNDSSHEPQTMRFRVVLHALLFSLFKNSLSLSRIRFNADQLHLEVASTQFAHLLPDKHMNLAIESALNAHGHQEAFQDRELLQVMDNKVLRMGFCELRTITRSDGDVIEPRGHLRQWCDASHRFWPGGYSGWWEVKLRD